MIRTALLALVALVLVPASAGAGTTRPPVGLTATPARISLAGSAGAAIRVTNPGGRRSRSTPRGPGSASTFAADRASPRAGAAGRPRRGSPSGRRASCLRPARARPSRSPRAARARRAGRPRRARAADHPTVRPRRARGPDAARRRRGRPSAGPGRTEPETRWPAGAPGGRRTAPRAVGRERRQRDRDAVAWARPAPRRAPRRLDAETPPPRGSSVRARAGSFRPSTADRCAGGCGCGPSSSTRRAGSCGGPSGSGCDQTRGGDRRDREPLVLGSR